MIGGNNMGNNCAIFILMLILLLIIASTLFLLTNYIDKRDNRTLYFQIKLGPFVFVIDINAKNVKKKSKKKSKK